MQLVANSVTKTTRWLSFLLLSSAVHAILETLFTRVKPEIQIRDFFPAKTEKSKIREIKLPRKISRHAVNCERVCFSCNLSEFESRFQKSRIRELSKFFGQESYCPPKLESAHTPMG